jgi:hypothetical protein
MTEWTKVLSSPLGLAGYALFLVFGFLAKVKRSDERRWLAPAATCLAIAALFGGLLIAYLQVSKVPQSSVQAVQPGPQKQQTNSQVQQTSGGPGSPNVQGVQGDVTISVDQSKGEAPLQKPIQEKPKQKKM